MVSSSSEIGALRRAGEDDPSTICKSECVVLPVVSSNVVGGIMRAPGGIKASSKTVVRSKMGSW